MNRPAHAAGGYVFGSSAAEITRLNELAELLQPSTRQVLREAGITDGMTVLDIGCGPGSVAFLNAELVGRAGSVTGIDRDPAMLATARAHALSSAQPVSFIQADLAELGVGRLILLHLDDPVGVLRRLVPPLHPGGVVVFQEPDLTRMGALMATHTRAGAALRGSRSPRPSAVGHLGGEDGPG